MSRKLLAFLLSELETVRIVCKACSAVTEMATEKAEIRDATMPAVP